MVNLEYFINVIKQTVTQQSKMGKETNLLEAARTGNLQIISSYITKVKSGSSRSKSHKKLSFFTLHSHVQSHRRRSSGMSRSSLGLDCCDLNGETPLHLSTLNNHKAAVILLMNGGAQPNLRDNQGCLPLHLAAWTGNVDICKTLLLALLNSDVNCQNKAGDTALHIASQYGHTAVVRLLLQHEANPMIRNARGESSLDLSAFYGRLETVSLLVNEQPALMQQMQHSHSPLHLAAKNGQKDVVRKLLQAGYNINAKTMAGSALHEAAMYGKAAVIKLLIQSGIDQSIKDNKDQTAEEMLSSHNSSMSRNLLAIFKGEENLYHSLIDPSSNSMMSTARCSRHKLCKHGKLVKDESYHRRTRERSSSGQTSDSGSTPPTSPPPSHMNAERPSSRHHRSECRSASRGSPSVTAPQIHQSVSQGYITDNPHPHSIKCCHGHLKQSIEPLHHIANEMHHMRHMSGPTRVHHSVKDSNSNITATADQKWPEKCRHKSASAVCSDYIKLSEMTSFPLESRTDQNVYNKMLPSPNDHCYDKMDNSLSSSDSPIYDAVPKPFPVTRHSQSSESPLVFSPLSPSFNSTSVNHSSIEGLSATESQDSVYNSPGSLSPEFNGLTGRRYLGHIYVNLSRYRSTPDLHRLGSSEAPRKPPRNQTPDTEMNNGLCKSTDYVCVDIDPVHLSKSQDILSSDSSFGDRLPMSVPPCDSNFGQAFVFPPVASLAKEESDDVDDDIHAYENMPILPESHKARTPPKAMPRTSKSKQDVLSSTSNNNNFENSSDIDSVNWSSMHSNNSSMAAVDEEKGGCRTSSSSAVFSTHL